MYVGPMIMVSVTMVTGCRSGPSQCPVYLVFVVLLVAAILVLVQPHIHVGAQSTSKSTSSPLVVPTVTSPPVPKVGYNCIACDSCIFQETGTLPCFGVFVKRMRCAQDEVCILAKDEYPRLRYYSGCFKNTSNVAVEKCKLPLLQAQPICCNAIQPGVATGSCTGLEKALAINRYDCGPVVTTIPPTTIPTTIIPTTTILPTTIPTTSISPTTIPTTTNIPTSSSINIPTSSSINMPGTSSGQGEIVTASQLDGGISEVQLIIVLVLLTCLIIALTGLTLMLCTQKPACFKKAVTRLARSRLPKPPPECAEQRVDDKTANLNTLANLRFDIDLGHQIARGRQFDWYLSVWRGDQVAVKVFKTAAEKLFEQEIHHFSTYILHHENIVEFHDNGHLCAGNTVHPWMFLAYHPHGSLFDFLSCRSAPNMPADELGLSDMQRMISSIATGLSYLHCSAKDRAFGCKPPIAHRNLKSKNILVKRDGTCCISDLSLAISQDRKTNGMHYVDVQDLKAGSPRYMAPEVLSETIKLGSFEQFLMADVYSVALIMWEIAQVCCQPAGETPCYILPYSHRVPADPTLEDMHRTVCIDKARPPLPSRWRMDDTLAIVHRLISACWKEDGASRFTSKRIYLNIQDVQTDADSGETAV